ncbi:MAG: hypothetical protein Q3979_07950 [Actinomycetaceae bacterium]|nr:hypothetical protein [Actinomycetaceae bacterium]
MPQMSPYDVGASGGLPPQTASAPPTAATFSTNSSASAASTASAITSASAATPSSHADPRDVDGGAAALGGGLATGQGAAAAREAQPAAGDTRAAAGEDLAAAGRSQATPLDSPALAAPGFDGALQAKAGPAEAGPAVEPTSGAGPYGASAAPPDDAPFADADSASSWPDGRFADHPEQAAGDAGQAGSAPATPDAAPAIPATAPDQTVRLDAATSSVSPSAAPATREAAHTSALASPATTPMPTPTSLTPTTAASAPSTTASPDSADAAHSFFTRDSSPTPDADDLSEARGRGWAHVGTFVATLVLVPVVWYLLSDASIRLSYVMDDGWQQGTRNVAAIGELAGGLAVAALLWHLVRYSSLGAQLIGAILAAFGLTGLLLPQWFDGAILDRLDSVARAAGNIGENTAHHLRIDVGTGRLFVFGAIVFLTGLTAHYVRRRGHRDGVANADRGLVAKR